MGYRCRWQSIGRNDLPESTPISSEYHELISMLSIELAPRMKTIFNVLEKGILLGQVRTKVGGDMFYRTSTEEDWQYAGFGQDPQDPPHSLALVKLLKLQKNQ